MRIFLGSALLALVASASAQNLPFKTLSTTERLQTGMQHQQKRIDALAKRGKAKHYEELIRSGIPRTSFHFTRATVPQNADAKRRMEGLEEETKREAAINLAALGFTVSDVERYRRQHVDLYEIVDRFFSGETTPEEPMLLADTIVVVKTIKNVTSSTRLDGFRSAISFKVMKVLKGSLVKGDVVCLPQLSGINPDGTTLTDTSDIRDATPGKTYLMVMSRAWYEQWVAERAKRPEVGFNALAFLAFETAMDGSLKPSPRPTIDGKAPKNLKTVEAALKQMPHSNS